MNRVLSQGLRTRTAIAVATMLCLATAASPALAAQLDIVGLGDSGAFGTSVTVLPNGNIVITDPEAGASKTGAVYLYGPDRHQISRLTGGSTNDQIGSGGIVVLGNGNFVIGSPNWSNAGAAYAGAATWVDGRRGLSGVVSANNSLVGTTTGEEVGGSYGGGGIVALNNGNYVVASPRWNDSAGAVTWGSGTSGVTGTVSAGNSLVGATRRERVGESVTALANGNYVVASPDWAGNGIEWWETLGAVTWANGATGLSGLVSSANSLIGTIAGDRAGLDGITALSNGNYVVASSRWNHWAGAATWGNGTSGTTGLISADNSLVGTTPDDAIGADGVTALSNGNYVVASAQWNDGVPDSHVGAVTWGNGAFGTIGAVSSSNSLVGSGHVYRPLESDFDFNIAVTPLRNGNYVVASPRWSSAPAAGSTRFRGAATWGNGMQGAVGSISPSNSLVGTESSGRAGEGGVVALGNGNYVVVSPGSPLFFGNPPDQGSATWGNGDIGTTGLISASNSLMGDISQVTALANGNYVAIAVPYPEAGGGAAISTAIWGDGASGTVGLVSADNPRPGLTGFQVFSLTQVTALSNGHYVINNPWWSDGLPWSWFGAVTRGNGAPIRMETVSASNSLVGTEPGDLVGSGGVVALSDGNYVVTTVPHPVKPWPHGEMSFAAQPGGVTLVDGRYGASGTFWSSATWSSATVIGGRVHSYDPARQRLAVGRPQDNIVTLLTLPPNEGAGHARRSFPPQLLRSRDR